MSMALCRKIKALRPAISKKGNFNVLSNFGSSNVSFSNASESSKTAVGPEFSAIYFMHF